MVIVSFIILFILSPTMDIFPQENNLFKSVSIDSVFKWDIEGEEKGAMMFLDVPYQKNSNDSIEYLTITVAIAKTNKRPEFISFIAPSNVKKENGVFIKFTKRDETDNKLFLLKTKPVSVPFFAYNSSDNTLTARINDGYVFNEDLKEKMDVFINFLRMDFLLILLTYPDETHKTLMIPLYFFQNQYRTLFLNQ